MTVEGSPRRPETPANEPTETRPDEIACSVGKSLDVRLIHLLLLPCADHRLHTWGDGVDDGLLDLLRDWPPIIDGLAQQALRRGRKPDEGEPSPLVERLQRHVRESNASTQSQQRMNLSDACPKPLQWGARRLGSGPEVEVQAQAPTNPNRIQHRALVRLRFDAAQVDLSDLSEVVDAHGLACKEAAYRSRDQHPRAALTHAVTLLSAMLIRRLVTDSCGIPVKRVPNGSAPIMLSSHP